MGKTREESDQIATPKNFDLVTIKNDTPDGLTEWAEWYFDHAVTTTERSRKEQRRDIGNFLDFMNLTEKTDTRPRWTPRLSEAFKEHLQGMYRPDGKRSYRDRTINRMIAHLKTFAKWIHGLRPFPLGNPMQKIKSIPVTNALEIERAITPGERRRLLDAADILLKVGGLSKSRRRYAGQEDRPVRKGYRPYRNRAIIYTLVETGMRRQAVTNINIDNVDSEKRKIVVKEKGGMHHSYQISREGQEAIQDYITRERKLDDDKWGSPALFLTSFTNHHGNGRLTVKVINQVWNEVCRMANVKDKTPHSARHGMGRFIIEKTGNIAAVQRQLGHKNAAYSMQYSRITDEELNVVLDGR